MKKIISISILIFLMSVIFSTKASSSENPYIKQVEKLSGDVNEMKDFFTCQIFLYRYIDTEEFFNEFLKLAEIKNKTAIDALSYKLSPDKQKQLRQGLTECMYKLPMNFFQYSYLYNCTTQICEEKFNLPPEACMELCECFWQGKERIFTKEEIKDHAIKGSDEFLDYVYTNNKTSQKNSGEHYMRLIKVNKWFDYIKQNCKQVKSSN